MVATSGDSIRVAKAARYGERGVAQENAKALFWVCSSEPEFVPKGRKRQAGLSKRGTYPPPTSPGRKTSGEQKKKVDRVEDLTKIRVPKQSERKLAASVLEN